MRITSPSRSTCGRATRTASTSVPLEDPRSSIAQAPPALLEQLRFVAVAVLEEWLPGARGVDHRLELGRGAAVESQGIRHEATLGHRVTSTDR